MPIKKLNKKNNFGDKKLNGVVYTPQWIVDLILNNVGYTTDILGKTLIDPACGDGAFLKTAVERLIVEGKKLKKSGQTIANLLSRNIYGFDIDENALSACQQELNLTIKKYGLSNIKWRLTKINSLDKNIISQYFKKFDFVIGNPPYIRIQNLDPQNRLKIQKEWSFCHYGSTDIFIAFFELGWHLMNKKGKLGFITPNTFLKTKAGESLRNFLQNSRSVKTLIDFGHNQIFDNATTYSLITILDKTHSSDSFSLYKGDSETIQYVDNLKLSNLSSDNWILTSNKILERLRSIEKRGVPLNKIAKIHVGITTLADEYYIFQNPVFSTNTAMISLRDGRSFEIEKNILKPIVKASTLKSPDENQNRFIIFPYEKIGKKHQIIPEEKMQQEYPLIYNYFLAIKNSLLARDKGKPNSAMWYAFGRSQGLDTSFGKKILTSPINLKPNFLVWEKDDYTFYAGYCIKFDGDLGWLANQLNSEEMNFYIQHKSRDYQNNYKSFAKSFIENFTIDNISPAIYQGQNVLF